MRRIISRIFIFSFLSILALSTILPLIYMFLVTFKTKDEYFQNMFSLPKSLNFDNYINVLSQFNFLRITLNSIIVSLGAILLSLLITSMAGFSVSKLKFSGKKLFVLLILSGMFMPGEVLILPVYQILIKFNLVNNFLGLILFYVATSIPFTTFLIIANLRGVPNEIIESSRIDGASSWKVYFHIILPMLRPTLATVAILNFIGYWNELLYALILLQDPNMKTVTISVVSLINTYGGNPPLLYAGLFLSALPVIIVFFIFQRHLTKGVSSGAIK
jgi:raffinose/stachyose/melibiose transport system permease protein